MNFEDIKNLTPLDLNKKIRELRENLFKARMENTTKQMKNPMAIRQTRRDIARLKTALTRNTRLKDKNQEKA